MKDFLSKCKEVKNGRDANDIYTHLKGEVKELKYEVNNYRDGNEMGVDGVEGEAVDVILCALDLISITNPNFTMSELEELMDKKFKKWKDNYGE